MNLKSLRRCVVILVWFGIGLISISRAAESSIEAKTRDHLYSVGVAKLDITPSYPVLMNGYFYRTNESTGSIQPIFAKALAIGTDAEGPAILISADNCGLPGNIREALLQRLQKRGITPDKLAICVSHTHSAPKLAGNLDNIFGKDIPAKHQVHIDRYTKDFLDKLEKVALTALKRRKPASISWGKASADFATNRRVSNGPVDHDLPFLKVTSASGKILAVLATYACHCTTIDPDSTKICGDWAGFAQTELEQAFPGAVALMTAGCGAECNPAASMAKLDAEHRLNMAKQYGRMIADAVRGVEAQGLAPLSEDLQCRSKQIDLPFAPLPTRKEWEALAKQETPYPQVAYHARKNLARLDRGESLPTKLSYPMQVWNFGNQLAMVFLGGEVVGDYSLRLKQEFDSNRLWVTSYANAVPCYIPSHRVWKQHGYEADFSMNYYDLPTRLAETTETTIFSAIHQMMPEQFVAAPREKTQEEKKKVDIYLLMGQSNMQGRGKIEGQDVAAHARVVLLTASNHWDLAVEPVHEASRPGVGPGLAFGKTMAAKNTNQIVALVPCAVGGTLLKRWEKGGDLYANALARARNAMRDGVLKGILWHQGEQDSILETDAASYHDRLMKMIADIRADLDQPNLPFVVGQIGEFLYTRKKQQTPFAQIVNRALQEIPHEVSFTACVESKGLTHVGDEVHFDAKSERELGRRFATKMMKLQTQHN